MCRVAGVLRGHGAQAWGLGTVGAQSAAGVAEFEAPEAFSGVCEFGVGGEAVRVESGEDLIGGVFEGVGEVPDGDVVNEDVVLACDGDGHVDAVSGCCLDSVCEGFEDVLGFVDSLHPTLREALGAYLKRMSEAIGVMVRTSQRLNGLLERAVKGDRSAHEVLHLLNGLNECAEDLWQNGLDASFACEFAQELVDPFFERGGDCAARSVSAHSCGGGE